MDFIGRKKELELLEKEYSGDNSLTIVYGRRRVGKTTLITEFMKGKKGLYFLATQQSIGINLRLFSDEFSKGKDIVFSSWEGALEHAASEGYRIIAIDEFQYLASVDGSIPSVFQHAWDTKLRKMGVMLILCGSYIGMMERFTLNRASPLYGRRTCSIRLEPLSYFDVAGSRKWKNHREAFDYYGITGGVPRYMEVIDPHRLKSDVSSKILDKNGILYEEPMFLLNGETRDSISYIGILSAIARGNTKLDRISSSLQVRGNSLSPYLETLIGMGIVERRMPVTAETGRGRNGRYVIRDRFMQFWFRFVFPYLSALNRGIKREAERDIAEHMDDAFMSFVFEDVCREYVAMSGDYDRVGSYWTSDTEIDVVAVDEKNRRVLFGECKYHRKPISSKIILGLTDKCESIKAFDGYERRYAVFSASGFTDCESEEYMGISVVYR